MKSIIICLFLVMISGSCFANINDGLVLYYPFNGNANDESNIGVNGTVNNAILTTDRFGNVNSAYSFDGTNSYIFISKPIPSTLATTNAISLVAWINPTEYPDSSTMGLIVGSQCDSCRGAGAAIHLEGREGVAGGVPGGIHFQIGLEGKTWTTTGHTIPGQNNEGSTDVVVPLNQWTQIVATWQSGDIKKVYFNGSLVTNWALVHTGKIKYDNDTELSIGRQYDMDRYFSGSIDDVRIYNRVLSDSEIQELYNEKIEEIEDKHLGIVGDINNDGKIDLLEVVHALQVTSGIKPLSIGPYALTWKGYWKANSFYKIYDAVHFDGSSYICIVDHTSELTKPNDINANYWEILAKKGEDGRGQDGQDGQDGESAISIHHEWNGTSIRFQKTDGSWGYWVDLKGNAGEQGAVGPQGPQGATGPQGLTGPPVSTSAVCVNGEVNAGICSTYYKHCSCSSRQISKVTGPCEVTSDTGSCSISYCGTCCVCGY